jgi:hypothetical protein
VPAASSYHTASRILAAVGARTGDARVIDRGRAQPARRIELDVIVSGGSVIMMESSAREIRAALRRRQQQRNQDEQRAVLEVSRALRAAARLHQDAQQADRVAGEVVRSALEYLPYGGLAAVLAPVTAEPVEGVEATLRRLARLDPPVPGSGAHRGGGSRRRPAGGAPDTGRPPTQ